MLPAATIITLSTLPVETALTCAVAAPFPIEESRAIVSPVEYNVPPSFTVADVTIFCIVNLCSTSEFTPFAVRVSPSINVPITEFKSISNSVIESAP